MKIAMKDLQRATLCVLEKIKYQTDIVFKKYLKERESRIKGKVMKEYNSSIFEKLATSAAQKIRLTQQVVESCNIGFGYDLQNILKKLEEEGAIEYFQFVAVDDETYGDNDYYEIVLSDNLDEYFQKIKKEVEGKIVADSSVNSGIGNAEFDKKENKGEEFSRFTLEKILDVMLDIYHELEMTNRDTLTIPLLPPVVKFSSLMPADSVRFRDRYCHYRWQTLKLLQNKGAIKNTILREGIYGHRWTQEVEIEVNKDIFYKLFNEIQDKYKNLFKPKINIDGLSNQDIGKLKKILDVINIRLGMSHPPHIIYIPFKEFPKEIQRFEVNGWLWKLDKDFDAIKFTNIVGREPSEQEAEIRIKDDKQKFNEFKKVIDKKFDEIMRTQPNTIIRLTKLSFDQKLCRLRYSDKEYTPQRKGGRCQILKELWKSRRIMDLKNKVKREGAIKPVWELAIVGGFVKDEDEFNQKKGSADRSVRDAIQDLRDKFKEMKAPIEITAQNGYILVIRE